jgi:hypothetical protein
MSGTTFRKIERTHPDWITTDREPLDTFLQRWDWIRKKGGFWNRVENSPESVAAILSTIEGNIIDKARTNSHQNRSVANGMDWRFETTRLNECFGKPLTELQGWNGDWITAWRMAALDYVTGILFSMSNMKHPYHDWLKEMLDLDSMRKDESAWHKFWLYEVQEKRMRRFWMRWSTELFSALRRVSPGTSVDQQLSTYLIGADHFITADKTFNEILTKCRQYAPVAIAQSWLVSGGANCANEAIEILSILQ